MDKKRALKLSSRVLTVITIVVLVTSLYNIVAFLSTIISGDNNSFDVRMEKNNSTGSRTLSLNANPRNNGFLPVNFFLEMSIYDMQDNRVATNSSSVYIEPGGSQPFTFTLTIPSSFAQDEELRGDEGYMQMRMSVRTLGDLVGLSQVMTVGAPVEATEGGEASGGGGGGGGA